MRVDSRPQEALYLHLIKFAYQVQNQQIGIDQKSLIPVPCDQGFKILVQEADGFLPIERCPFVHPS